MTDNSQIRMDGAANFFRVYQTLRAARPSADHRPMNSAVANSTAPANLRWFDVAFTPSSLEQSLQEHGNDFVEDVFGGLRCRTCNLPAIYRTLHLSIFINGRPIGTTTTRALPVCVMCHEFDGEIARLCLTTEEAVVSGLVHPPQPEASDNVGADCHGDCGGLTDHDLVN